ncbi:hypothetical protein Tco_1490269 [Tanacetum coccineum]
MFTNEHTLDYSSPPLYDDVDDDLVELVSENDDDNDKTVHKMLVYCLFCLSYCVGQKSRGKSQLDTGQANSSDKDHSGRVKTSSNASYWSSPSSEDRG